LNNKNGNFEAHYISDNVGNICCIVAADFNNDGMIDLYVGNHGQANQLYINKGNGKFHVQSGFQTMTVLRLLLLLQLM
jgi:hypothetical protein